MPSTCTLHDVIVRTRRMQGFNTLWLPGTDHAGIATQNVVEREIAKDGKSRHDLGRERFVDRVWEWRETYGGKILNQLRRLGASCDWSRERFTLDPGTLARRHRRLRDALSRRPDLSRLSPDQLVYPRCETALSDLEVDHKDAQGNLWYIRYPLTDGSGSITVATTRPETMLGDTAVAVHPATSVIGTGRQEIRLPLIGREIPIVADASVDRDFGTGAVKITPAHDFNDFELGRRHNLPQISVMDTACADERRGWRVPRPDARGLPQASRRGSRSRRICWRDRAAFAHRRRLLALRHHRRADALLSMVRLPVNKPGPNGKSLAGEAIAAVEQARPPSIRSSGRTPISPGCAISRTGASRANYGGAIGSPPTGASAARNRRAPPIVAEERPQLVPQLRRCATCAKTRTFSIPGFRRDCGPFRPSDGPIGRSTSSLLSDQPARRPASTSFSSGSRG